jgi:MFS family permease
VTEARSDGGTSRFPRTPSTGPLPRAGRSAAGPREAARLIRSRNFGPYFFGNALSASGAWFQSLAAALLVYRQTESEFLLGVLSFSMFVPVLVLAPWAGAAADRFDRKRLILVAQLSGTVLATALAVLAWLDLAPPGVVIALVFGTGISTAFATPATLALIASLVPERDVASAVGLNSMTYNIARAAGPALAALVVATAGIPVAFAVNAVSYGFLVVGVLLVHPRPHRRPEGRASLRESIALVRREPRLAAFLLIVMLVGYASDPINTLSPAFANEFGRPDTWAGFIVGAFGAGAVLAAILLSGRVAGSPGRMALTLTLLGGGVALFSLTPWLALALPILVVGGFGYLASATAATARLQLEVAESQRGRIMALWGVAFLGVRPFASLVDGAIASSFGVRAAGVVMALPALLAAAAIYRFARRRVTATAAVP